MFDQPFHAPWSGSGRPRTELDRVGRAGAADVLWLVSVVDDLLVGLLEEAKLGAYRGMNWLFPTTHRYPDLRVPVEWDKTQIEHLRSQAAAIFEHGRGAIKQVVIAKCMYDGDAATFNYRTMRRQKNRLGCL